MRTLKSLAMFALLINVLHSAELPEDHPIKTALQMTKHAFAQYPERSRYSTSAGGTLTIMSFEQSLPAMQKSVINNYKICIDTLFLNDELTNIFFISSQFNTDMDKWYYNSNIAYGLSILTTLDSIVAEINKYIHQSFEDHFHHRKDKKEFASAYKLAVAYRDANIENEENVTKVNAWIDQIGEKATTEITRLSRTVKALIGIPDLELDYRTRVLEIINSFPIESRLRIDLQTQFEAILAEPRSLPDVARLTLQRDIAEILFT